MKLPEMEYPMSRYLSWLLVKLNHASQAIPSASLFSRGVELPPNTTGELSSGVHCHLHLISDVKEELQWWEHTRHGEWELSTNSETQPSHSDKCI